MKGFIALSLPIMLTSCLTVSLNQPQPKDGVRLKEFPEELQGRWTKQDGDFVTIDANQMEFASVILDSLDNIIDTSYRYKVLSDTLRVYRGGNYYVFNERNENGTWRFATAKIDSKGNIRHYLCDDFNFYAKLKGLKLDSASYTVQHYLHDIDELLTKDTVVYASSLNELSKINSDDIHWVHLNGQIRIRDLRKIAVRKNLILIYKADGTIEESEPEPDANKVIMETEQ